MKLRTRRILSVLGIVVCGLALLGYFLLAPGSPLNRSSAIRCISTWGRLAPFPPTAQHFTISTEGNMFSRAFRASFIAPTADIEQWLQQSPGTHEAIPDVPAPGVRHFLISPGGGAVYAEVTVDDTQHRVSIYVYWS